MLPKGDKLCLRFASFGLLEADARRDEEGSGGLDGEIMAIQELAAMDLHDTQKFCHIYGGVFDLLCLVQLLSWRALCINLIKCFEDYVVFSFPSALIFEHMYPDWLVWFIPEEIGVFMSLSAEIKQAPFAMSEWLLPAARNLSTLTLDFLEGAIWIKSEDPKLLSPAFSNIRDMFLCNIFAESDLSWTMFVLEAAPSLKNLYITLSRHECRRRYKGSATKIVVAGESFEFRAPRPASVGDSGLRGGRDPGAIRQAGHGACGVFGEDPLAPHELCDRCSAERYRLWEALQRFDLRIDEREFVLTYMRAAGHPYRPWKYPSTERDKGDTRRRLSTGGACSSLKIVIGHIGEGRRGAMVREVDAFLGLFFFFEVTGLAMI